MRALHFDGSVLRFVDGHPEPEPAPDEATVRVRLAGVCSTDLQILAGYMGFRGVPGHEFVGDVVAGPDGCSGSGSSARSTTPAGAAPPAGAVSAGTAPTAV